MQVTALFECSTVIEEGSNNVAKKHCAAKFHLYMYIDGYGFHQAFSVGHSCSCFLFLSHLCFPRITQSINFSGTCPLSDCYRKLCSKVMTVYLSACSLFSKLSQYKSIFLLLPLCIAKTNRR